MVDNLEEDLDWGAYDLEALAPPTAQEISDLVSSCYGPQDGSFSSSEDAANESAEAPVLSAPSPVVPVQPLGPDPMSLQNRVIQEALWRAPAAAPPGQLPWESPWYNRMFSTAAPVWPNLAPPGLFPILQAPVPSPVVQPEFSQVRRPRFTFANRAVRNAKWVDTDDVL